MNKVQYVCTIAMAAVTIANPTTFFIVGFGLAVLFDLLTWQS